MDDEKLFEMVEECVAFAVNQLESSKELICLLEKEVHL